MKLHFDSNQEYQIVAIRAVTDIFEGQPLSGGDFEFSLFATGALLSENGVGNRLTLTEEQIWENVKRIQQRNGINTPQTPLDRGEIITKKGRAHYLRAVGGRLRLWKAEAGGRF